MSPATHSIHLRISALPTLSSAPRVDRGSRRRRRPPLQCGEVAKIEAIEQKVSFAIRGRPQPGDHIRVAVITGIGRLEEEIERFRMIMFDPRELFFKLSVRK